MQQAPASDKVAKLTDSELGAMAEALAGAQYSQKQESEADDYGVEFCVKNGIDPYAMANCTDQTVRTVKRCSTGFLSAEDVLVTPGYNETYRACQSKSSNLR